MAGVELSLAVAAVGSLAGVSAVEELAVLGPCVCGTGATGAVVFGPELGVEGTELAAGSGFEGGVLLVLAAKESCFSASTLAFAEAERDAGSRLERLEVLLFEALLDGAFAAVALFAGGGAVAALRLGACTVSASATETAASRALVVASPAEGGEVFGAGLPALATVEECVAIGRAAFSEPLRLWSISRAPPITVAVMAPNAIPKCFMASPGCAGISSMQLGPGGAGGVAVEAQESDPAYAAVGARPTIR